MRLPNGARPMNQTGDIHSQLFYTLNVGPVAVIALNNYGSFTVGSLQYAFAVAAFAAINKAKTPWVIVTFHAPPYHNFEGGSAYKIMECFMGIYEPMFLKYGVDFVISGCATRLAAMGHMPCSAARSQ